jgi:hypothetical protein
MSPNRTISDLIRIKRERKNDEGNDFAQAEKADTMTVSACMNHRVPEQAA